MADGDEPTGDEPVTRAEFTSALEELRQATQELRDARTPEERREARSDVGDAEDELAKAARALGLSRDTLAQAARDARAAERREELRPIVAELWDEREEAARVKREEEDAAATAQAAADAEAKRKPKPKGDKTPPADDGGAGDPPADDDDGPTVGHWSDRGVGSLLK